MKQIPYNPSYFQAPSPEAAPNLAGELDRISSRQLGQLEENRQLEYVNNSIRVGNAKREGEIYKALANFSDKALSLWEGIEKQSAKDRATGEVYDAFIGEGRSGDMAKAEAETAELQAENLAVARTAEAVEAETGSASDGEYVREALGQRAAGYRGEKVAVLQARSTYSSWLPSYLNSDQKLVVNGESMTYRDASKSLDPAVRSAALQQARFEFLKQSDLYRASKDVVVKELMPTMLAVEGNVSGSLATATIKASREAETDRLNAIGFRLGQDTTNLQGSFDSLSELFYTSGTGLTRAQANKAAVTALAEGMAARGDVDGIEALMGVAKINGQAGTELGIEYGALLRDYREKASTRENKIRGRQVDDLEAEMYLELRQAKTPEEKGAIIERYADRLDEIGEGKKAQGLRDDYDSLTVDGSNARNNAQLKKQIDNGEVVSPGPVNAAYEKGLITESQRNALLKQLKEDSLYQTPEDPGVNSIYKDRKQSYKERFLAAMGYKVDNLTKAIVAVDPKNARGVLLSKDKAQLLVGQMQRDLLREVNRIVRENPNLSDEQLQSVVTEGLNKWAKGIFGENGKYPIDPILKRGANANRSFTDEERALFNGLITSSRSTDFYSPDAQDFSGRAITSDVREQFNALRGDTVIEKGQAESFRQMYQDEGVLAPSLVKKADALGMTPLALLQSQLLNHGLDPVNPQQRSQGVPARITSAVEGAQVLMSMGLPARGASWLSGNIQQESSWRGNRTWDDDGSTAGGVVSWRGDRLAGLEAQYGRPVTKITTKEQLQYMLQELKKYPEADAIFRNPRATERQLIRASKAFWGYGKEGRRFEYARSTEAALSRPGGSARNSSGARRGNQSNVYGSSGYVGSSNVYGLGLNDAKGREIKLSPNAAEAFREMRAAGMPFNSADVASVYRDEQEYLRLQRQGDDPASNSTHNHGEGIDAHGAMGEWIRKNGAKYGWYPNDYPGTHGGHFEFRK